jgi:hypothetical protein
MPDPIDRRPPFRYEYQDICPDGSLAHDGQICVILTELSPDEAGLPRYRVRFGDGAEAEALEPELQQLAPAPAAPARQITVVLPDGQSRTVAFVPTEHGEWVSDAVVAVRRNQGQTIYAAAVHLDPNEGRRGQITLAPQHLSDFRGLRPSVLGWANRPEIGWRGELIPDADASNWDPDAVVLASPERLIHLHESEQGVFVRDCAACGRAAQNWIPANGGREVPFTSRSGRRLLWCYQPATGEHAYVDCDNDLIISDEEARLLMGLG